MKTVTLNIIKKNRLYFACKTERGYNAKLKINDVSKDLKPGVYTMLVEDLTTVTEYGVNAVYEMYAEVKKEDGIVKLSHGRYNKDLVKACKTLGGRWDANEYEWVFHGVVRDQVKELDYLYNHDIVDVEIEAIDEIITKNNDVYFAGYPLTKVELGSEVCRVEYENATLLAGKVDAEWVGRGWRTITSAGTKFRLRVSKHLVDNMQDDNFNVTIL